MSFLSFLPALGSLFLNYQGMRSSNKALNNANQQALDAEKKLELLQRLFYDKEIERANSDSALNEEYYKQKNILNEKRDQEVTDSISKGYCTILRRK